MMLEKCARVSYSVYRTLKFLKTLSLLGTLVFRNLCYISASVGALSHGSQLLVLSLRCVSRGAVQGVKWQVK